MSRLIRAAGLAILLLAVIVVPAVAQGVPEAVEEVLKSAEQVEGWRCRQVSSQSQSLTGLFDICQVEVKLKPNQQIGMLDEKLLGQGFRYSHWEPSPTGDSHFYNAPSKDWCNLPPGGVFVTEPAAQPKAVSSDTSTQTALVTVPSKSLPKVDPPTPELWAGLWAWVGTIMSVVIVLRLFVTASARR